MIAQFYKRQLDEAILPFWLKNSIDGEHGGIFTCFENASDKLISTDKYTWSQGRAVWLFSALAGQHYRTGGERARFLAIAKSAADFLKKYCLLPNGNCAFVLTREGTPKPQAPGMPLDSSVYADCFVVYGLAKYSCVSGDKSAYDFAESLYRSIIARMESRSFASEPYPQPQGYKMHGIPMIALMISEEMGAAAVRFAPAFAGFVEGVQRKACDLIMNGFVHDGVLHEMIRADGNGGGSGGCELFDRFVNPGHTIEDMWIMMHLAESTGDKTLASKAAELVKSAFARGWDDDFGGLTLFADEDGGRPKGGTGDYSDHSMAQKVLNDWDNKLWWVHSEALYATLLAHRVTGDREFMDLYEKAKNYAFATFPNPDASVGEWIQIRDRQGAPAAKVVALPVKDPFHIARNMIQIIALDQKEI